MDIPEEEKQEWKAFYPDAREIIPSNMSESRI
jgi:hypothetical protein